MEIYFIAHYRTSAQQLNYDNWNDDKPFTGDPLAHEETQFSCDKHEMMRQLRTMDVAKLWKIDEYWDGKLSLVHHLFNDSWKFEEI